MEGYKHTELGWIPEDWEVRNLGVLAEKVGSGITPKGGEKVYKQVGRPFIRSQNVGWGDLILSEVAFIDEETHKTFGATEIKLDDVFLNITGASIGRSAVADKRILGGNVNQHVCIIRTKKEFLIPKFLNAYLISTKGQNLIESYQAGGNRQGLNYDQIRSFIVPLPSLNEQKEISKILATWDKSIETLTQLIAAKQQLKKGLMQQLLTGKKRLPGFKGEWHTVALSKVAEIDRLSLNSQTPENYQFQYLSLSDVEEGSAAINSEKIYFKDAPSRARRIVNRGDVLISTVRPNLQGFLLVKDEAKDLVASTGFAVVTCIKIHNEFLYQYLFSRDFMKQIEALLVGSNYPAINSSDVANLLIPYPMLDEQIAIASILAAADNEIVVLKRQLEKFRLQKKGLMQQLLTGKKRVKV